MTCEIKWNTLSIEDWESRFSGITRSNILQSYRYAVAYCPYAKQKARWGLILIDGRECGLVQIFEAGILWNMFHAVILDRGPLWFDGCGHAMHVKRFYEEFNRQFPIRRGRKRRVLPELADGAAARKLIEGQRFKKSDAPGYDTFWLDLRPDEDTLRADLKSNWRNKLNKAGKHGYVIESDIQSDGLGNIIGIYAADKAARNYGGPSPAFLRAYLPLLIAKNEVLILRAVKDGIITAFIILVVHGRSATYFTGWSSPDGRDGAAHHLLLWDGIMRLKKAGIKELDLGGINDGSADGVKIFKEGLGGDLYTGVGLYS